MSNIEPTVTIIILLKPTLRTSLIIGHPSRALDLSALQW